MKHTEKQEALRLRKLGYSIGEISRLLAVSKSSVSIWVRDVQLNEVQLQKLTSMPFSKVAVEKRRLSRIASEQLKRDTVVAGAKSEVPRSIDLHNLWLIGVMLYWAEGGKTQRMVRFSNGDPEMIKIMMRFFRLVCKVPEAKFRGYIHIHPHLSVEAAENYWSTIAQIHKEQFFKTYNKINSSSKNKKDTLPYGVMDIYVLDTKLFLKICGWAQGIFSAKTISNH